MEVSLKSHPNSALMATSRNKSTPRWTFMLESDHLQCNQGRRLGLGEYLGGQVTVHPACAISQIWYILLTSQKEDVLLGFWYYESITI